MSLKIENIEETLRKFGDQTEYTEEEEKAIEDIYKLIDEDDDLKIWRKYAQKNLLIVALRSCNLDVKWAFRVSKILHHHATKTYPDLFAKIDPMFLEPIIKQKLFKVVKRKTDEGPAIIVVRIRNWDPATADVEHLALTGALYFYAVAKMSAEIQRKGIFCIADVSGFKFVHARQASVDLIMKAVRLYQTIPPMVKGLVAINAMPMFEHTYSLFKWILPESMRKLIHITKNDMTPVTNNVSEDRLPCEFGGTIPDDEAYIEGIEDEILKDPMLFELIKHLQEEFLNFVGMKRQPHPKFKKKLSNSKLIIKTK